MSQYTTVDVAEIFDCDVRVIQERIHNGQWPARDLPKRGRFLSCDLEEVLSFKRAVTPKPRAKGGRRS